jgi:Arc/MetJ-type ribon-helix-helix transcriptional regulator
MSTLNVKIPEEMEADIERFLDDHPSYVDKGEFVRDTLRQAIERPALSERTHEDDRSAREQIENGEVVALPDLEEH